MPIFKKKAKKAPKQAPKASEKEIAAQQLGGGIAMGWNSVTKQKFPFVVDFEDFYLFCLKQDDERSITELRNGGKTFGEILFDDDKQGVQGNVRLVAIRKR